MITRTPPKRPERPLEWTAGIDWFRAKVTGSAQVRAAHEWALEIQREDESRSEKVKPWRFQGYEGKASPRVRWGRKGGALFWETSGAWADRMIRRAPMSGTRCTRIDLQSTVRFSRPQLHFGTASLPPEATIHPRRLRSGIPVGLSTGADGMWLGTVGRRTSPEYFRMYDKGVETRDHSAGYKWRLELEVKYSHASELCLTQLENLKDPAWCASYAISRWLSLGCLWPTTMPEQLPDAVRPEPTPAPSYVALLRWMEESVSPAVFRALKGCTVTEVLRALGLEAVAEARRDETTNGD